MFAATVKSYAKVNLALNVTGCAGGYHLLDSVVASVDIYDTVRAKPRKDALVNVYMRGMGSEGIPPEANNAVRAAEAFVQAFWKQTSLPLSEDVSENCSQYVKYYEDWWMRERAPFPNEW